MSALSNGDADLVDEVLEESLTSSHDAHVLKTQLSAAFERAPTGAGAGAGGSLRKRFAAASSVPGKLDKAETCALLEAIHGHRIPKDRFERIWSQLGVVTHVDYDTFRAFVEPPFDEHRVPPSPQHPPTPPPKRLFKHLFGFLASEKAATTPNKKND